MQANWAYKRITRVPGLVIHSCELLGGSIVSLLFQLITSHRTKAQNRSIQAIIIGFQFSLVLIFMYVPHAEETFNSWLSILVEHTDYDEHSAATAQQLPGVHRYGV